MSISLDRAKTKVEEAKNALREAAEALIEFSSNEEGNHHDYSNSYIETTMEVEIELRRIRLELHKLYNKF